MGLCFSKNFFQRNCFTGTMSWNGPCIQRNCFNKNSFQRNCFSKNFFQRNSFSRNCSTKSPMSEKSICSMCRNQQPISPNIVPRNRFQGLFFHMSLIHISKPSIIPKHLFDGSRGSVRSFRHSVPSFRHSLTSLLSTFRQSKNCLHFNKQYSPKHGSVK